MTELKCPFCNKPLVDRGYYDYMCPDECDGAGNIVGNESMWQELIDIKKKLDIAVDGITYMRNNCLDYAADYMDYADGILEQITAEQTEGTCETTQ